ncbi:hypothetical protein R6Q59_033500, partial [Mikania micrantha]
KTIRNCKMANKSVVMAPSLTGEAFELINGDVSDSDSWQVIDPSDSDAGNFSSGDVSGTDDDEELVSDADNTLQHPYGSPSSDIPMQYLAVEITRHYQVFMFSRYSLRILSSIRYVFSTILLENCE